MQKQTPIGEEERRRLFGLTDGIFAIALTLIVLEIRIPSPESIHNESDLIAALGDLIPRFATYAMSFLTLMIFWFGQQSQHNLLTGTNRRLTTLHLVFLAVIALLPFSTDLLAEYFHFRIAVIVY
ncbi:MAG: TMEM175 family protein [Thermomicrobiales bacterium]